MISWNFSIVDHGRDLAAPPPDCPVQATILCECQLEILQYIGEQFGTVLWTGSPGQRKRAQGKREQEEKNAGGLQLGGDVGRVRDDL